MAGFCILRADNVYSKHQSFHKFYARYMRYLEFVPED